MIDLIKEGDQVIVKKDENLRVFTVREKRQVFMEKVKFTFTGAIGHPYGSMFEVKDFQLVKVEPETSAADKESGETADNRDLKDASSNQKLSRDDIEEMKGQGVEGGKIIEKLVEHSNTFENKTEFSKAKYLKKKKKKFMKLFTIVKPTTRLLCELHYTKGRNRILGLRMDSVSQILAYANVRSGCNLILHENCAGLLLGAILKRLGDEGTLLDFYIGSAPVRPEAPEFSKEYYNKHVYSLPLDKIKSLVDRLEGRSEDAKEEDDDSSKQVNDAEMKAITADGSTTTLDGATEKEEITGADTISSAVEVKAEEEMTESQSVAVGDGKSGTQQTSQPEEKKGKRRKEQDKADYEERRAFKQKRIIEATELAVKGNFDGLIVASKFHPKPIVMNLMKFVAPSRPIVVYSQYQEPLIDLYKKLREQGNVVNLTISETWFREYQVLPMRSHPQINMSGSGGFLLTGIKVLVE
ncbi:tRNA (adenine(58)-N(1))-methyltransferase non-catalytic subunit TRM6-like [Lineus longissimus]|uniref:tRNA (adenine(58)-N(1))-methyltransferase non-catalytic subunit TRM6-like n=1 Tax=Lineus longissimus TaxID=88925 RepID=UPI00315CC9C7